MNGPADEPRFRAMEIGPGGFPADRVSALGSDGHPVSPSGVHSVGPTAFRAVMARSPNSDSEPTGPGPSAVFGSFEDERQPSRRAVMGWLAIALVIAVLVGLSLWSNSTGVPADSAAIATGDCLMSSGDSVISVDCSSSDGEFRVTATYTDSTDSDLCAKVSSDLVLVTRDEVVLCLDYLAKVGDCLYAGAALQAGKAPCRTPGSTTTPVGLFRVIGVLRSTTDPANCPKGTIETLVHTTTQEVVCLGLP